jgi:hypothetical protein
MNSPTELRHQLRAAGYAPIPLYGKEPPAYGKNNKRKGLNGWQTLIDVSAEQVDMWERTWPDAANTGCLTRLMPTLDLDILNEEAVRGVEDYLRKRYADDSRFLVRIGKPPKRAILFQTDKPFAKILANITAQNGSGEKIELLANGQQIVVAGIHPETQRPYTWHGGEPWLIKRIELPYIDEGKARQLIDDIIKILSNEFGYRCVGKQAGNRRKGEIISGTDWQTLYDNIREGRALHDSLRDLAAKLISSGTSGGAAVNQMRALMESSIATRDDRWKARLKDIPRLVATAEALQEREREAQEQKPAMAAANLKHSPTCMQSSSTGSARNMTSTPSTPCLRSLPVSGYRATRHGF